MKNYASWKYLLLIAALLFGLVYAAPNLYGDDPSVQISLENGDPIPADLGDKVAAAMKNAKLTPIASGIENEQWVVRLSDAEQQLRAADELKQDLGRQSVVALTRARSEERRWGKECGSTGRARWEAYQ